MAYRHYVLFLLLLVYIHCLLSRMLPAFLSSVPVPGCETACKGAVTVPLCHQSTGLAVKNLVNASSFDICQRCRARRSPYDILDKFHDGNWYNMRDGACIAQWQYGILFGYGFALPFVFGSIVTARIIDLYDPRLLLSVATVIWSLACAMMGSASDFLPLLACRFMLGASEAVVVPSALSLITQYFDEGSHGTVASIFSAGVCLGSGTAAFAVPLALHVGWQDSCRVVGYTGIVLSGVLFFTVSEPSQKRKKSTFYVENSPESRTNPVVWVLAAAASLRLAASYTIAAFLPMFYVRAELPGYSPGSYATSNAVVVAFCGLISAIGGGVAVDYCISFLPSAPCIVAVVGQVVAAILFWCTFQAGTFVQSFFFYGLALLFGECWYGMMLLQVKSVTPVEKQGRIVTTVLSIATIVSNLSPAAIGALDPSTAEGLGRLMSAAIISCIILSACFLVWAAWRIEHDDKKGTWPKSEYAFDDSPDAFSDDDTARKSPILSRRKSLADTIQRQVTTHIFFGVPGQADVFIPDVHADTGLSQWLLCRSKTEPVSGCRPAQ